MIPTSITAGLISLKAQVAAATPLLQASRSTVVALKLNAAQLVSDVEAALKAPNNTLDTWTAPTDPALIISGVLGVLTAAQDQTQLSFLRGLTGRAAKNLGQLPS